MDGATTVAAAPSRQVDGGHQYGFLQPYRLGPFRLPHRIVMALLKRSWRTNRATCRVPSPTTTGSVHAQPGRKPGNPCRCMAGVTPGLVTFTAASGWKHRVT